MDRSEWVIPIMPRSHDLPIVGDAWQSLRPQMRMRMATRSQGRMKYSHVAPRSSSPPYTHTHSPLTWNSNTEVLWVLCHHLLLQLMQSGSQRPWKMKGRLTRDPAELPPHPSRAETSPCPGDAASPTDQNHQAGPLTRLVLVPGHLLIGQQLQRLRYHRHLSFLRASQPLPAAQPEAPSKTSFGGKAGDTMPFVPGPPTEDSSHLA